MRIIIFLVFSVLINYSLSVNAQLNQLNYSFGINQITVYDEYNSSVIFKNNAFQPLKIFTRFANEKWRYQIGFYYLEDKLYPLDDNNYEYNFIFLKTGQLNFDILRKISLSEKGDITIYTGLGAHSFFSNRKRSSLHTTYGYEDLSWSYDFNQLSLQVIVNPEIILKKNTFSLYLSSGFLNYTERPDSYNPTFYPDEDMSDFSALSKHFNITGSLKYTCDISRRFSLSAEYTYFYYRYSYPYLLKFLSRSYLGGLVFKF